MLAAAVRTLLVALGGLAILGGLVTMVNVDPFGGLWLMAVGILLVGGALIERRRYRSAEAEASSAPAGPGGGEETDARLEPRFKPTPEVFVDPTSGHRMRVLVDPATGERRYRAEG